MIITIILISIALIGSLYANYNLLKKYEQGEEYISNLETWFVQFSKTITSMNKEIEKIDTKGSFSSDDEVGYFFKELKKIIAKLNTLGENE
tara:strand:- start:2149 stop:2421 length:273 start_codon:yes stop_codon:yes gene_type:complete